MLPVLAAWGMAGILLCAGLEKLRDPAPIAGTIRGLGAVGRIAKPAALVLAGVEIAVALGLVFRPDSFLTQGGVVALALAFGSAGAVALLRDEPIRCGCFGAGGSGYLGWKQVTAMLPWFAGAAVLRLLMPAPPPLRVSATGLASIGLGIAAARAISVVKAQRGASGDRRSAEEMISWLRSPS